MSRFLFRYFRPEHLNPRLDRQSRRAVRKKISYVTVDIIFELNYRGHAQNCCAYTLKPADPERLDPVLRERGSQNEGVTTLARTKSLSKQIRQAREGKGFTVAELADRLGVSQVSIYYWESGRVRPRDTNLTALCKALKMPMKETMALTGR